MDYELRSLLERHGVPQHFRNKLVHESVGITSLAQFAKAAIDEKDMVEFVRDELGITPRGDRANFLLAWEEARRIRKLEADKEIELSPKTSAITEETVEFPPKKEDVYATKTSEADSDTTCAGSSVNAVKALKDVKAEVAIPLTPVPPPGKPRPPSPKKEIAVHSDVGLGYGASSIATDNGTSSSGQEHQSHSRNRTSTSLDGTLQGFHSGPETADQGRSSGDGKGQGLSFEKQDKGRRNIKSRNAKPEQEQSANPEGVVLDIIDGFRWAASIGRVPESDNKQIEVEFNIDHKLFEVGGMGGRVVSKVSAESKEAFLVTDEAIDTAIPIQAGWRVVACNGKCDSGPGVLQEARAAQEAGNQVTITFEFPCMLDESVAKRLLDTSTARLKLQKLSNKSLDKSYLENPDFQRLLVEGGAVRETQVLLGEKDAVEVQKVNNAFTACKKGDVEFLTKVTRDPKFPLDGFSERDGSGNVMLHHAADLQCVQLLLEVEPGVRGLLNSDGQSPLHTFVLRNPKDTKATPKMFHEKLADLFRLDCRGVSAAMRKQSAAQEEMLKLVPPWSAFRAALEKSRYLEIHSELKALNATWEVPWRFALPFHLFGENAVWEGGQHTKISTERLKVLWKTLRRTFAEAEAKKYGATDLLRELLLASKGPCVLGNVSKNREPFDPREPYRKTLFVAISRLRNKVKAHLNQMFEEKTVGPAGDWLKAQEDFVAEDIQHDSLLADAGLNPKELWSKGIRFRISEPEWVAKSFRLDHIYKDLQEVGMVGALRSQDGVHDLLEMAKSSIEDPKIRIDEQDCFVARWFGAWLRGCCQKRQTDIARAIQQLVGLPEDSGSKRFFAREAAKEFPRICEKTCEIFQKFLEKMNSESRTLDITDSSAKRLLRWSAGFITDINGCTYVAQSVEDLQRVATKILADCCNVDGSGPKLRQVKNGFHKDKSSPSGYRDMKFLVEDGDMLVEVQLLLDFMYLEKELMHVPYEFFRGSFDWPHLWQVNDSLKSKGDSDDALGTDKSDSEHIDDSGDSFKSDFEQIDDADDSDDSRSTNKSFGDNLSSHVAVAI